jgi:ribosomal protein S18 acetylase RimI-like enzyme
MSHYEGLMRLRDYVHEDDFIRIRDFLRRTRSVLELPVNWGIDRWNYARYFVAPMLGSYGDERQSVEGSLAAIRMWEDMVRVWETDAGDIAGVACIEHPDLEHPGYGEIFVQRHPDHIYLLEDVLAYGEERFANPKTSRVHIWVCEGDSALGGLVRKREYTKNESRTAVGQELELGDLPEPGLPAGYEVLTMADECDIDKRREIFGRAFDHPESKDWPSRFAYEELMRAPDYRPEQDLFIKAPDNTYAACCIIWLDGVNRIGHMEPVGTHPDYRGLGLGRAIVYEALRRMKMLGIRTAPMDGGNVPFYEALGFRTVRTWGCWAKEV